MSPSIHPNEKELNQSTGALQDLNSDHKTEKVEDGWPAVKQLFKGRETGWLSEELKQVCRYGIGAFFLGFVYGGMPASKWLRQRYIDKSQAETYEHRVYAIRDSHNAGIRGLIRYGWRWGWRVAALTTVFQGCNVIIAVYRNKVDVFNYVAAAGVAGSMYKIPLGPRGMFAGGILGSVLGIPVGLSIVSLQMLTGENILEQFRRERRERIEMHEEEVTMGREYVETAVVIVEKELIESETLLKESQSKTES
ncbi:complex I assembly factor TIMMDC1, mitochondrial-like [Glandiceps talaboti]